MRRHVLFLLVGLNFVPYVLNAAPPTSYAFTTIEVPFPGALGTVPLGINDHGTIVGFYSDDSQVLNHGFLLEGGLYTALDVPFSTHDNKAFGINNRDQVVGRYSDTAGSHGFVYNKGMFITIDVPDATVGTEALDINDRGQIVGVYSDTDGDHGFLDDGDVFGSIDAPVSGALTTTAFGINNRGQIVGRYLRGCCVHGFVLDGRAFATIDFPGAFVVTEASGINDRGVIVGNYQDHNFRDHGFRYERGVFSTFDVPFSGASNTYLFGINNRGEIIGLYTDRNGNHSFVATPE